MSNTKLVNLLRNGKRRHCFAWSLHSEGARTVIGKKQDCPVVCGWSGFVTEVWTCKKLRQTNDEFEMVDI
jgi:hypothetical protein